MRIGGGRDEWIRDENGKVMRRADGQPRRKPGRKKTGKRTGGPHRRRPELDPRHPAHVTLRSKRRTSWRHRRTYDVLRHVLAFYVANPEFPDFRICHLSIQRNHLHLIVEAGSKKALSRGMQSFAIRAARAMNRDDGGCDKVFAYRYHASQIRTAKYARHALAYVLNNWRRHREDFLNGRMLTAHLDEYSSAVSFTGFTMAFAKHPNHEPLPVSAPATWLLREGWKRYGTIDPQECPGPLW
jgi:putative transposase